MIELAPRNKRGLTVTSPLLAGSGAVGFGDAWPPALRPSDFGAIVTAPVTMRPQKGSEQPRLAELPAGFVLAVGEHNPGFRRVVEQQSSGWRKLGTPVIISLAGRDPGDRAWMAARLEEGDPGVAAIELAVPEDANLGETSAFISATRQATTLPILVKLPSTRAAHLAETCAVAGADALVLGAPPPVFSPAVDGSLLSGPLSGPVAFGFTLRSLQRVVDLELGLPIVAAGGIHSLDDVALCLEMGAAAVQIRSLVWIDPAAARRLARASLALTADEDSDREQEGA
jgi:dihydroorotate dehydrogenase (NAD+) catalytic subunit